MRVALISPYDFATPGGVTEHVTRLDEALRDLGHETVIVAPVSSQKYFKPPANLRPVGRVIGVPTNGSIARISLSIGLFGAVRSILGNFAPEIVHLHEPFMPLVPFAALRHSTATNVATFHAYSGNELGYRHVRPLLGHFAAKLHGRIAVSTTARSYVCPYFPGQYTVIPNGVNLDRFQSTATGSRGAVGVRTILFVGRLDERKGFEYLFRAFRNLKRCGREVRLVVVGSYGSRQVARFKSGACRQSVNDVYFAGYASPLELARHYLAADIVCAPSLGGESFGTVLLEAMAAGKPIVASRIAGYDEVVSDGQEGFLIAPGSTEALQLALDRLLADGELRVSMGRKGREKAERYAWPVIADRVARCYQETVRSQRC